MKAILFGAVIGLFITWPSALPLTLTAARTLTHPAVLTAVLSVLALGTVARHARRWVR
ncbi:hypothetical protein [Streptomyces sp. YIM S03343]